MAWYDQLISQGYLPPGAKENTLAPVIDSLSNAFQVYEKRKQDQEQKKQQLIKNQVDMYRVLRDSGYPTEKAYEAAKNQKFPELAPTEVPLDDQRTIAEIHNQQTDMALKQSEAEIRKNFLKLKRKKDILDIEGAKADINRTNAEISNIQSETQSQQINNQQRQDLMNQQPQGYEDPTRQMSVMGKPPEEQAKQYDVPEGYKINPNYLLTGKGDPFIQDQEYKASQELEQKKNEAILKGPGSDLAGRVTLAKEALKSIDEARSTLFPDGTPNSFKRGIAFGSNLPGPGSVLPLNKNAQDVFRKIGTALSGRQLIQTGVAARPEETRALVAQFAPSMFSDQNSAFAALQQLEDFYKEFLKTSDPETRFSKQSEEVKTQSIKTPSPEEIKKAKSEGFTHYNTETGEWLK